MFLHPHRSRTRDIALYAALLGLALVFATTPVRDAQACDCSYPTFEQAFAWSSAVFQGTVLGIVPGGSQFPEEVLVVFWRTAHWKTALGVTVLLLTADNEGICGYTFMPGTEYLVYASGGPVLRTDLCSRTHAVFPGDPDLVALGPSLPVATAPSTWSGIKRLFR